jgi:glycosyltransferase involved in cell wall biosynthesis
VRLCVVVQRYGPDVTGGAEMHARWLARRLAASHDVEVVTTCALDYATWENDFTAGPTTVDGLRVTRYPVDRPRSERLFALYSDIVFRDHHTPDDERTWVEHNGPYCPSLLSALEGMTHVDLFLFYSYRYFTTCFGLPRVKDRAVLVPTAEDDRALRLPIFAPLLRAPRGILYLTPEERDLVQEQSGNGHVPCVVIGSGIDVAQGWESVDPRLRFGLPERYLLYVGRIDWAKGVDRLVHYYRLAREESPDLPPLVLAGKPQIELPEDPAVRCLGVVSDQEKSALIAACDLLLLPSAFESLSISVLEAWAMERPVLVNAECRVLEGQCLRSNGGLFYKGYAEFAPALRRLLEDPALRAALGRSGRAYVEAEYGWDVVEARTAAFLASLADARPLLQTSG